MELLQTGEREIKFPLKLPDRRQRSTAFNNSGSTATVSRYPRGRRREKISSSRFVPRLSSPSLRHSRSHSPSLFCRLSRRGRPPRIRLPAREVVQNSGLIKGQGRGGAPLFSSVPSTFSLCHFPLPGEEERERNPRQLLHVPTREGVEIAVAEEREGERGGNPNRSERKDEGSWYIFFNAFLRHSGVGASRRRFSLRPEI